MLVNYNMKILSNIKKLYHRYLTSSIDYAKYLGVNIGDNNFINTRSWGSEPYLITIGNHVQITDNVIFNTHGGAHVARRTYPNFDLFGKIEVKDWAYIGSGSHIMPGVTIGEGSLIAAGSIVTKSVPNGEVWGGVPAKFICTVEEYMDKNQKYNINSKYMNYEQKKKLLLSLPDEKFIKK